MDDQQEDNNTNNEVDRALPTATIQQTMAPYGLNTGQESFVPRINPATLFQPIPTPAFLTAMQQQAGRHSAPTVPTTTAPATVTTSTTTAAAATTRPASFTENLEGNKKAKAKKKKGKTGGLAGTAFTKLETKILLGCVKRTKPIGKIEWLQVLDCFNSQVGESRGRDEGGIRRKFRSLADRRVPTGDPNIPDEVRLAKDIDQDIVRKSELITGDNMSSESGEVIEDDEEPAGLKTTGLDDPSESSNKAVEGTTAPSTSSTSKSSTKKRGRPRKSNSSSHIISDSNDLLLHAFIESERMAAKREKARDKKDRRQMKMFMALAATAITAFSGKKKVSNQLQEALSLSSSEEGDSDSTLSSYDSADSGPTKRKKIARLKKKARKARK